MLLISSQALQRTNSGPVNPSPAQLSKLRNDLNMVEENVRVMSEMLTAVSPDDDESEDVNLLKVRHSQYDVYYMTWPVEKNNSCKKYLLVL